MSWKREEKEGKGSQTEAFMTMVNDWMKGIKQVSAEAGKGHSG